MVATRSSQAQPKVPLGKPVAQVKMSKAAQGKEMEVAQVKEVKVAQAKEMEVAQVKEVKVAQAKEMEVAQNALLQILQGKDVTGLCMQLKDFMAPLDAVRNGVKGNMSRTKLHNLAEQYVPFLLELLKLCFMNVANLPVGKRGKTQSKRDEVFMAVEIALDSLDLLRSFITGSPFEIEIQRCSFIQHLLAWRRHLAALGQCRKNFSSLCLKFRACEKGSSKQGLAGAVKGRRCAGRKVAEKKRTVQISVLPHPQDVELTSGLPTLVSEIVTNLIWCTGESAPTSSESYRELLPLPRQLEPWLMTLDADVAGKQRDKLYEGLYKCVTILVANPGHYGAHVVREFAMLTLQICAASSLCKQYLKVAYKISHCLSSHGATYIRLGLEVSEAAMKGCHGKIELQSLWADTDVLELVDRYARLCQTNKYSSEGGAYLCDLVDRIRQLSPSVTAILGFYVIGLKFCSEAVDVDMACLGLLRDGAALMESCLQQETEVDGRKCTFCILRAFEMANKNLLQYAEGAWSSFTPARDAITTVESETVSFNSTLRRVLHLWYLLLRRASEYCGLTREEDFVLEQGWSLAYTPLVSLLQLSLMSLQGLQDSAACVDDLLKRGGLRIDVLKWIMAKASKMGMLVLKVKDYESACLLLRVAYDAGWAMAEAGMKKALSQPADYQVDDLNLENCSKCTVVLAGCLSSRGKNNACIEILDDGLLRWATIHSTLIRLATFTPGTLVHARVAVRRTQEYESLDNFIKTRCQALHHQTIDLLLGEELLSLQVLEDRGLDDSESLLLQALRRKSSSVSRFVSVPNETMRKVLELLPNSECTLCYSKFSEERKRGCMVPCGHASACFDCATKALERKRSCPWCHACIETLIPLPRLFL